MAEAFRVDPEALADAVAQMAEFQWVAEGMVNETDSLVNGLHEAWTGAGASAHAEAHRLWVNGDAMMREALAELRAAGKTAHTNYTGAIAKNLDMWS